MPVSFYSIALVLGIVLSAVYLLFGDELKEYKKINSLVLLILMSELLSESIWTLNSASGKDSFLLYNILYVYLRPTVMLLLFSHLQYSCHLQRKVLPTMGVFLLLGILNSLFFQSILADIQSYSFLIGHGMVLFYCIIFFKDILHQNRYRDVNLLSLPYFWMASLILFSFGESYIFFILTYYLPSLGNYSMGHIFHWVQSFGGIMYLTLGLSFYAPLIFKRRYSY
ncbi:hypothetical protein [Cyclobacterium jeungdonense]|uniref:Uncharacterized protein n=1 Tax=Cyclobacterium jeungdonense TaxID=708087 RepID=A0ABT8C4M5_9BACT|nr:hypothetical protein [Cyclobacterium jeungdonense]MDN3687684.1 hypothetical protein [Cyclobacterium jeungdonense]